MYRIEQPLEALHPRRAERFRLLLVAAMGIVTGAAVGAQLPDLVVSATTQLTPVFVRTTPASGAQPACVVPTARPVVACHVPHYGRDW